MNVGYTFADRDHLEPADLGPTRFGLVVTVYNLFNTTDGIPASVQNIIGLPNFGQPLAAFPGRQVEVGVQLQWGGADR